MQVITLLLVTQINTAYVYQHLPVRVPFLNPKGMLKEDTL